MRGSQGSAARREALKYDRKWVQQAAQCPEGAAWGLEYTKDAPKTLQEAVGAFQRADWLLWFLVKAEAITLYYVLYMLWDLLSERVTTAEAKNLLDRYLNERVPGDDAAAKRQLIALGGHAAHSAEIYMTTGSLRDGHELSAVAFQLRLVGHMMDKDEDQALKGAQCVLNNLVAARTGTLNQTTPAAVEEHQTLCKWLAARVIILGDGAD